MKQIARKLYKAIPGKLSAFTALRQRWKPPKRIWEHLYFEGDFETNLYDTKVMMRNYNSHLETAVFWKGLLDGYEPMSQKVWYELCKTAMVIFDVGANTGLYSIIAKVVARPAQIWSFEPIERIYQKLLKNLELNQFEVNTRSYAICDFDGMATIYDLPKEHHWHASLLRTEVAHLGRLVETRVPTCRLDTLIEREIRQKVDLIKIDVEGNELAVLKGMERNLPAMRPSILLEVKSDRCAQQIEQILLPMGYQFFDIAETSGLEPVNVLRHSTGLNILACRPEIADQLKITSHYLFAR